MRHEHDERILVDRELHQCLLRPEVRDRIADELARRESREALVPLDRDPVPTKYSDRVRRYYEELGRSR